ncbi:hypothetical protein ACFFRR_003373 [Megaselia abdita]
MNGSRIWDRWCRLCAKESGDQINILVKSEEESSLCQKIIKYFNIEISSYDDAPHNICFECEKYISDLIVFSERTKKVQVLFSELEYIDNRDNAFETDISALREKYGVNSEKDLYEDLEGFLEEHIQATTTSTSKTRKRGKTKTSEAVSYEEPVMEIDEVENIGEDCLEVKIIKDEVSQMSVFDITPKDQLGLSDEVNDEDTETKFTIQEEEYDDDPNDSDYEDADFSDNEDKNSVDEKDGIVQDFQDCSSSIKTINYECNICGKLFGKELLLRRHLTQNHDIPLEMKFSCSVCGKGFMKESHRRRHEKMVHKAGDLSDTIYPCPFCDKKFQKAPNVKTHIKVVHSLEKPYICEECGKAFKTIGALKEHKYTHTEECPFQCGNCDKRFKNRARLKTHEDTHKDTTYVCTICGLQLNTRRTLKMHMLVHSDQKKHKCNYCGNEFKRAKALKNHLILHTGLKPYTCNFCDKTFANGSNCRSHKKKSHPYELAALEASGTKSYCQNMPKLEHLKAAY